MLYEPSDFVGQIIAGMNGITGSLFVTLLILSLLVMALCLTFSFPLEYTIILILPLHIGIMAYSGEWLAVSGSFLIYLGILFAKNLLAK